MMGIKRRIFVLLSILSTISTGALAQSPALTGSIINEQTGDPLAGANVKLEGTSRGTVSGRDGRFAFEQLPEGEYMLTVSYLGFETERVEVEIEDDETEEIEIALENRFLQMKGLTVEGIRKGQAQALNEQREALNIKNIVDAELISTFPDPNVGEALKRIPGINIQSDQGEARYVQIRGTKPNLSNITINGSKVAAPEGDGRSIALDMIPSDVLASIEVTKAITPDMDGDAIGGTVNLETKSPISQNRVLNVTLNGGYHNNVSDLSPLGGRASLMYGQRIGEGGQFGYMLGANYNKFSLGSDNNEMAYDAGELEEMELRDYELTRERFGGIVNLDYRFSRSSQIYLNTSYNYFADQEYRRLLGLASDEAVREFKDRLEEQKIFDVALGGTHSMGERWAISYRLSYAYSDQNTPQDREVVYAQSYEDQNGEAIDMIEFGRSNINYPQFSLTSEAPAGAGIYNYGAYDFDELVNSSELTTEQHVSAKFDLSREFIWSDEFSGTFKAGALTRLKNKDRDLTENIYGYNGSTTYRDMLIDFRDENYLFGHYDQGVGLFPSADNIRQLFQDNPDDFERDPTESLEASEAEDYDATEDTYAGYVMTELQWGPVASIIGVRYEHLETSYEGNIVEYNQNEELIQPIPTATDENNFDFVLPMIHLKYNFNNRTNIRLAWTNTYAKPNYFNLVPYRIISRPEEEIELGNPNLEPARSMNLDLMAEYYFSNIGILSAGAFYKNIRNFIYTANFEFGEAPYTGYETTQPLNGETADLIGFEVALQRQLTFLPGFASGFGIYANYTYTWSEAELTTREGSARTVSLPGQASNVANLAVSYQKYGFSGRLSLNYSGAFVAEIREHSSADRYYDAHTQIDLSLSQQLTPAVQVFGNIVNLTNEPLRYYNGISTRPEQQEFYSFQARLGVKLSL